MHSVPFFTTSPTPSPTRPLHVPYTSPTSPTNFPSVVRIGRVIASEPSPTYDIPVTSGSERRPHMGDLMLKPLLDVAHKDAPE